MLTAGGLRLRRIGRFLLPVWCRRRVLALTAVGRYLYAVTIRA
jgi:hypothetical protein